MDEYKIDYDLFNAIEVIKIMEFFVLIEKTKKQQVSKELLLEKFKEYRSILNNKTMEKQYDKMLMKKSKVSIHQVMKNIL